MKKSWYARSRTYGSIYVFETKNARDEWVYQDPWTRYDISRKWVDWFLGRNWYIVANDVHIGYGEMYERMGVIGWAVAA